MITIELEGLPRMANGSYGGWQSAHGERKRWHTKVARELVGLAPSKPWQRAQVVFTRCSSSEPDDDGLVHGFKPIRDALVRLGFIVDDKRANLDAIYRWEKAPPKCGKVRLTIKPIFDETKRDE